MEKHKKRNAIRSCCRIITFVIFGGWRAEAPAASTVEMPRLQHAELHESIHVPILRSELSNHADDTSDEEEPKPSKCETVGPRSMGNTRNGETTRRTAYDCYLSGKGLGRVRPSRDEVRSRTNWSAKEGGSSNVSLDADREHERLHWASHNKARSIGRTNRRAPSRECENSPRGRGSRSTTLEAGSRSSQAIERATETRREYQSRPGGRGSYALGRYACVPNSAPQSGRGMRGGVHLPATTWRVGGRTRNFNGRRSQFERRGGASWPTGRGSTFKRRDGGIRSGGRRRRSSVSGDGSTLKTSTASSSLLNVCMGLDKQQNQRGVDYISVCYRNSPCDNCISACEKGNEWHFASASGRVPVCGGGDTISQLVSYSVNSSISACGKGKEWQWHGGATFWSRLGFWASFSEAASMCLDMCHDICWSIAYFCGILSVIVEHSILVFESMFFVGICCILIGVDCLLALECTSIIIAGYSVGYFLCMTCIFWSIWILLERGRKRKGRCRRVGRRRYKAIRRYRKKSRKISEGVPSVL